MLKRDRIILAQAHACVEAYHEIPIKLLDVGLPSTLALVGRLGMYAYDAYMFVCAQRFGTPLLTLDGALKVHADALGIRILEV